MNALSFLLPRRQIPPDMIKYIHMYCLDGFNRKGEIGRTGTSEMAMVFLANCFNQYSRIRKWPIACQVLPESDIYISDESPIVQALERGAAAVVRLYFGVAHYVLLTGVDRANRRIYLFDPYYEEAPKQKKRQVEYIFDAPDRHNRAVDWALFNRENRGLYSLGPIDDRECLLLENCEKSQLPESLSSPENPEWAQIGSSVPRKAGLLVDPLAEYLQQHAENGMGRLKKQLFEAQQGRFKSLIGATGSKASCQSSPKAQTRKCASSKSSPSSEPQA